MIDLMVKGLINQAKRINGMGKKAAETVKYQAIFITPNGNLKTLGVDGYAEKGDFVNDRATDITLSCRMRPSLYINGILPYKDNLRVQLISSDFNNQIVTEYVAIPLLDTDVRSEGAQSAHANVEGISEGSIQSYGFQLLEPTYAALRTIEISHLGLMGNMTSTISRVFSREMTAAGFTDQKDYQGLIMETPADNDINYSTISIPEGVRLTKFCSWLQESEKYGVYSKGLGCFFKQKRWWVYRLWDLLKYDSHPQPIEIIRLPEDKAPTLQYTFFVNDNGLTILATGDAKQTDQSDIDRQNQGVGMRLVSPDLVGGEVGMHYNAGRAIRTRADSMSEFQTAERGSGTDYVPLNPVPSSNVNKYASYGAATNGSFIELNWHCGDPGYLEPGAAIRYQFMGASDRMETRKGVLLGYRMDTRVVDPISLLMKRSVTLIIFLSKQST